MDTPFVKFAVQGPDDTLPSTTDAAIDLIAPGWVRFTAPAGVLADFGVGLGDTLSEENRVVMLVYLEATRPPIRAIGRLVWCERSPETHEDVCSVVVQFSEIAVEDQEIIQKHLQRQPAAGSQGEGRAGQIRRQSDFFFQEMARMVEILADMTEGKKGAFGEQFVRLVAVKNGLGRRLEDKQLGDAICYNIERMASNVARLMGSVAGLRKVRIRKVSGREEATVAKDRILAGWEEAPPKEGESYFLYMEGGGVFRSAIVSQVLKDHFRTRNSLYEIQEI